MAEKNYGEILRARREELGYKQEYMAEKLGITQSSYSRLESGETKITLNMIDKIRKIKGFEDFPESLIKPRRTIIMMWPWGKPLLYILIVLLGLPAIDWAMKSATDISRGFNDGAGDDTAAAFITLVFVCLFIWLIYWLFWIKKWW